MSPAMLLAGDALLVAPFVGLAIVGCARLGRKPPMARRRKRNWLEQHPSYFAPLQRMHRPEDLQ